MDTKTEKPEISRVKTEKPHSKMTKTVKSENPKVPLKIGSSKKENKIFFFSSKQQPTEERIARADDVKLPLSL